RSPDRLGAGHATLRSLLAGLPPAGAASVAGRLVMPIRWIIGICSGSGGEAVDAALLEVQGVGLEMHARLVQAVRQILPRELRETLIRVGTGASCDVRQIVQLHRLLGETYAAAARQLTDRARISLPQVQCVGC